MIETNNIDWSISFDIKFVHRDCPLNFLGYTVEPVDNSNEVFRLEKIRTLDPR
jgi:hypothetical protein